MEPQQTVLQAFARLGIGLTLFRNALAKAQGLSMTESLCLTLLGLHPGLSPSRLARFIGLSTGAMTTLLDRLEARGLVVRRAHDQDRRQVVITLNESFQTASASLVQGLGQAQHDLLVHYSPGELAVVARFLAESTALLETASPEVREGLGVDPGQGAVG